GTPDHRSGGETSRPSQVYLRGIAPPAANAALVTLTRPRRRLVDVDPWLLPPHPTRTNTPATAATRLTCSAGASRRPPSTALCSPPRPASATHAGQSRRRSAPPRSPRRGGRRS